MDNEESNNAVNDSAVESTDVTESAAVETNDSQVDEVAEDTSTEETDSQGGDDAEQSEETTEDTEAEETDTNDKPQSKGEKRVDQLNTEIRDLVAQRNAIRTEVEQYNSQVYKPAQVDELLEQVNPDTGEYYNRLEAQIESIKQERQVEKYNNQVAESLVALESDVQRVFNEFPMFDTKSAEYNQEIAGQVAEILNESLIRDPNVPEINPQTGQPTGKGRVIGSRISPYKLYKSYAAAAKSSAVKAETKAQKNVETMLKNADPTTSRKGAQSAPYEKMSLKQQEAYLRKKGHDI